MKKYKITDIIEDEFGCEGRPEGEEPMVTILLVDDTGKQRSIRMADKLAYEKKLDIGAEMELPEEEVMTLNGKEYKVKKLLGKGKGGYSYLVTDGEKEYVLKQIHHEPCSYYQFGNKLEAEKRDYKRLMEIGITMPKLLDIDETQERILKEYIPGDTVYQQVEKDALPEICRKSPIPVIADIHFQSKYVFQAIDAGCAAVRVNPGNIRKFDEVGPDICKAATDAGISLRIGVNAGSLDKELYAKYGGPTPEALVASALKEAHMFEDVGFHDFKISVKHHDVITMVETYRLLASKGDWPLHLGVTEAGPAWQGTIKSCLAFGALLAEGIGDTIRVSLSAPPAEEVKVGCKLLEYMGLRPRKFDIISCPSCGRAQVDVIQLASAVTEGLKDVTAPIRVAVMGCIVNGPGEAREADLGVASGNGKGQIFIKGKVIKTVPEDQIVDTLLTIANDIAAQMEADGQVPVNSTGPVVVPIQHPGH